MPDRKAVIYNPAARSGKALGKMKKVEATLTAKGIEYDLFVTESEAHMVEITTRLVYDYPVIIGVGGDTTINLIGNIILREKQANTLAVISQGSTNDLARGIGVKKLEAACSAIASGTSMPLDVGAITTGNNKAPYYFLAQASLGLGVSVNRYVDDWMKRHTFVRRFHYIAQATSGLTAIYKSFKTKAVPMNLMIEHSSGNRTIDSALLIFNNTSYVARHFQPSPTASPVDGKLDCCIFNAETFMKMVHTALQIKSMKHLETNKVEVLQDRYFRIHSPQPFEFQIDGEIFRSDSEIEISILPGALNMVVSPDAYLENGNNGGDRNNECEY